MSLVAAAKDGVVLYISEAEDVVEAGLVGGVEIADDGGFIGLLSGLRGCGEHGPEDRRCRKIDLLEDA